MIRIFSVALYFRSDHCQCSFLAGLNSYFHLLICSKSYRSYCRCLFFAFCCRAVSPCAKVTAEPSTIFKSMIFHSTPAPCVLEAGLYILHQLAQIVCLLLYSFTAVRARGPLSTAISKTRPCALVSE